MRRVLSALAWTIGLAVLLSPFFFVLYRLEVFNTLPRDDYAPYLLWLDGQRQDGIPGSPYVYRLFSIALAWPLLHLLPSIPLSNLPSDLSPGFLRATAALSALSYFGMLGTALLTGWLAQTEGGLDRAQAIVAGALVWLLCWYTQVTAIDPLALLAITAALCLIRRPAPFAVLMLVSVGVNEKIALTLAIWLGLRCLLSTTDRQMLWRPALAAFAAMAVYGCVVAVVHRGGNEYQLQPTSFPVTIAENLRAYLNPRGVLLNILPTLVLAVIAALGRRPTGSLFRSTDLLVIPAMLVVALVLTHLFQAGRLVMHAAPLFVIPAVQALLPRQSSA